MISKTKINKKEKNKKDSYIVETIRIAKKHKPWLKVAQLISGSRRRYISSNIGDISKESKEGDTVIVPGKVLGSGKLDKKLRVCALYFSASAIEKLKENKSESVLILDEIKKNPKAEGVKIIR